MELSLFAEIDDSPTDELPQADAEQECPPDEHIEQVLRKSKNKPLTPEQQAHVESCIPLCRNEVKKHKTLTRNMSPDDIEQEIRLIAIEAAAAWNPDYVNEKGQKTKFATFLTDVIHMRSKRLYAGWHRKIPSVQETEDSETTDRVVRVTSDEQIHTVIHAKDWVEEWLWILPTERHRTVLVMRFGIGFPDAKTVDEVAIACRISPNDVKSIEEESIAIIRASVHNMT